MVADETATRRALRQAGPSALRTAVALIYVFLLTPILIVVLTSFNPTRSSAFPPTGFSLLWYGEFFKSTGFVDAFKFSMQLGAAAAVIATAIGFASRLCDRSFARKLARHRTVAGAVAGDDPAHPDQHRRCCWH